MSQPPKRFFLVPSDGINNIVAESFPDAPEQRELPAVLDKKAVLINFAWELTANEITQLKKSCVGNRITFEPEVWVKCGDNFIRPAKPEEWDKSFKKRQTRKKRIQKTIDTFVISHGKFPHRIG